MRYIYDSESLEDAHSSPHLGVTRPSIAVWPVYTSQTSEVNASCGQADVSHQEDTCLLRSLPSQGFHAGKVLCGRLCSCRPQGGTPLLPCTCLSSCAWSNPQEGMAVLPQACLGTCS